MELVLILVVGLLVLGPKRMPELARTLGRGLGEFRRATNDLRQSLALDEIQNDLRDGLMGAGTIHKPVKKPEADDRPPQAGDDLTAGATDESETQEATTPELMPELMPELTPELTPEPKAPAEDDATTTKSAHPDKLPLDQDPQEHHDAADDNEGGAASVTTDKTAAQAADNELGTIPVGRSASAYRKAEQTSPDESEDDERG